MKTQIKSNFRVTLIKAWYTLYVHHFMFVCEYMCSCKQLWHLLFLINTRNVNKEL